MINNIELCAKGKDLVNLAAAIERNLQHFKGTNDFNLTFYEMRPVLVKKSQAEYMTSIGIKYQPGSNKTHKMYFGSEIPEVIEHHNGTELPSSLIENDEDFKREVIGRIKNLVGIVEYN